MAAKISNCMGSNTRGTSLSYHHCHTNETRFSSRRRISGQWRQNLYRSGPKMGRHAGRFIAVIMYVCVSAFVRCQFKWSVFGKPLNYLACGMAFKHRRIGNLAQCQHRFFAPNEYPRISSPGNFVNPYLLRSLRVALT